MSRASANLGPSKGKQLSNQADSTKELRQRWMVLSTCCDSRAMGNYDLVFPETLSGIYI